MEIRLLGALEVTDRAGEPVEVRGAKERALLALLALNGGRPVSRDAIVDALWPESDPESAAGSLRVRLTHLRRLLGSESVVRSDAGYALAISGEHVDALRFENLLSQGQPEDALALWRGDPLAGISGDWAIRAQRRLDELRLKAREEHLATAIDAGQGADRVVELQQLVDANPLRERPRELLMRALYQAGRQADALALYQETRRLFDEELGLEPSPHLRNLERAILTHDSRLASSPQVARQTRRSWGIAALAAAAAVVGAALVFWPRAGGAALRLRPNSIGAIDPSNGRLTAVESVGRRPIAIATGLGYVWVANAGDSTVTRLDPSTRETRTIGLPAPPTGIAVGHGAAWVAVAGPELVEVTSSGGTTDIPLPRRATAVAVTGDGVLAALGGGPFWRQSPLRVIDATTHRVVRRAHLVNPVVAATTISGRTWLVSNDWYHDGQLLANVLFRRGNRPVNVATIPSSNAAPLPTICVSGALGELWIPAQGANAVWHISSLGEIGSIALPVRPTCVAATPDRIWLSSLDGTVLQLNPLTSTTQTVLRTSASPSAIATGYGRIWVAAS